MGAHRSLKSCSRTLIVLKQLLKPRSKGLFAGNWSGVRGFEALPKHQFMTESTNINSLADHYIWSTIKTLPATLPKPSSMDRGPRTGVTEAVSQLDLDICLGVGRRAWAMVRGPRTLVDELIEAGVGSFVGGYQPVNSFSRHSRAIRC